MMSTRTDAQKRSATEHTPEMVSVVTVTPNDIARWLMHGATVVLPTETVYGLAVKPGMHSALQRVFELKGRPPEFNLPVVVGRVDQLPELGVDLNETAQVLAARFWPGPLTIVMGFRPDREQPSWLRGRTEVAIRFPAFRLLTDIATVAGPILLTSANRHGTGPKKTAGEAVASLSGTPDFVVDGGTLSTVPSTIVNTRHSPARVERVGAIAVSELEACVGGDRVIMDAACHT